jgi:signal transduction histidine kinase
MSRMGGLAGEGQRIATALKTPAAAGALLGLLALTESIARAASGHMSAQYALVACLLALCATLPLVLPGPVGAALIICAANVLSLTAFRTVTVTAAVAQLIVLYRLGRSGSWRGGTQPVAVGLALLFLVLALPGTRPAASQAAAITVILAALAPAAAWAGIAQQARHEAHDNRAARDVIERTLMEHTVRSERARIARELHDVVAHHISMVAVQAETARLTNPRMPAADAQRLSAIGDTARTALTEMRRLLGVLREKSKGDPADRRPPPSLSQLNDLLDEARDASGTSIRLILSGRPLTLDPGVELAAYRIAQEALTNARRHAPGSAIDVELRYTDDELQLRIRDSGPGLHPAALAGGYGLAGMRERAAAAGGSLRTGLTAGGGFLVEAALPAKPGTPA